MEGGEVLREGLERSSTFAGGALFDEGTEVQPAIPSAINNSAAILPVFILKIPLNDRSGIIARLPGNNRPLRRSHPVKMWESCC
ncbi:hypothetical protein DV711_13790 [Motiliproteus coralliicola]|uniref:Uncharacterized protein n=1 Tax=Motiliproteus coralliicola TaxID=2283196 RepID=A0A369WGX3_9GAMM|nr:hypothetical protein DV711_13790 [Motiliproteus coralliicola]